MVCSMTAFARVEANTAWGMLSWEIRSVNHRYLEPQFRLPEQFRDMEIHLRNQLRDKLARGKLDVSLFFKPEVTGNRELNINQNMLEGLIATLQQVNKINPNLAPTNSLELLRWPGVLEPVEIEYDELKEQAKQLFDQSVDQLIAMRRSEGASLKELILQRLEKVREQAAEQRQLMPQIMEQQKTRLQNRITEAKVELEPGRLEQEMVILLQKADVDEELDRLNTHVEEVARTLNQKGAVGRRLDFLMQELNREANTLSSKAIDTRTTQAAVELKVLIEQMREQIQNIE